LGMITSLAQDIERELRIQEQNAALRLANEQLQAVIDSIAEGVIAIDQNGRIIEANTKFQKLFQVSKVELLGSSKAIKFVQDDKGLTVIPDGSG